MTPEPAGLAARWIRPVLFLGRNRLSIFGAVLTTSAAFLVGFWIIEATASKPLIPYAGIIFILVLPFLFLLGLLLIPVGIWAERRRLRAKGSLPSVYPKIDLSDPDLRRFGFLVALLTTLNVIILTFSAYEGAEYMESSRFCGLTCHKVMAPEYGAYLDSPHSRVACTVLPHRCRRVVGGQGEDRRRPPGRRGRLQRTSARSRRPSSTLRPARATCEQCHWPQKFTGDKLRVVTNFAKDEKNTPSNTVLLLKLDETRRPATSESTGDTSPRDRISYVSRRPPEVIPTVNYQTTTARPSSSLRPRSSRRTPRRARPRPSWTASTATTGPPTPSSCRNGR